MTRWFTSDLHFYHFNVIRYCDRPFTTVEEMNEGLVENWNRKVKAEDEVYILGDFSLALRPVELFPRRLNGLKYLVPGNHDYCHPHHKKGRRDLPKWKAFYPLNGLTVLPLQTPFQLSDGTNVLLSHIPSTNQDPRYIGFAPSKFAGWVLCGHVHEKWLVEGNNINVGVDQWGMSPVSEDEIIETIRIYT